MLAWSMRRRLARSSGRLAGELNERQRRLWAASEARAAGRGGVAATARATGISVETIRKGMAELEAGQRLVPGRVRRSGGGRKPLSELDRTLLRSEISSGWLRRTVEAIRSRCCCGRQRASGISPTGCGSWVTRHISRPWRSCCGALDTACRRTSRRVKVRSILTAMPSSGTSTRWPSGRSRAASR